MTTPSVVLVLGMHRSGTSSVAELVAQAGFNVPGNLLPTAEEVNARGFWESQQIVEFNEKVLSAAGLSWFSLQNSTIDIDHRVYQEMLDWLRLQLCQSNNLVIKDPRINIILPIWLRLLDDLNVRVDIVYVNRYPDFVAASLEKRDGFSLHTGFALWLKYNWEALAALNGRSAVFVNFEELVSSKEVRHFLIQSIGGVYENKYEEVVDGGLVRNSKVLSEIATDVGVMARDLHQYISAMANSHKKVDSLIFESEILENITSYYKNNRSVLECLDDANKKLVYARKKMIENGRLYSEAVLVINEKDKALKENAAYISACHDRISVMQREMDAYVERAVDKTEVRPLYEQSLSALADSLKRERQTAEYIEMCHSRIAELYGSLRVASERADSLAVTLMDQERLLLNNNALKMDVAALTQVKSSLKERINQLQKDLLCLSEDVAVRDIRIGALVKQLDESAEIIANSNKQIAYLQEVISDKESNEANARAYIDRCHAQICKSDSEIKEMTARIEELSSVLADEQARSNTFEVKISDLMRQIDLLLEKEKVIKGELETEKSMYSVMEKELHQLKYKLNKIFSFIEVQSNFNDMAELDGYLTADFDEYQLIDMARQRIEARHMVNRLLEQQVINVAEIEALKLQLIKISNDPLMGLFNKKLFPG